VGLAGTGAPAEGRVLVTVAVPNAAPVANDDAASTRPGAAVLVPVLANDSDPDGDPLTIAAVVMSGHGTVAVDADQRRLRYVPQAGFVGRDSFAYAVSDGRGGVSAATVSVAVEAANGAPVARDDAALAVAGAPVTVAVLANDSDPDGDPLRLTGLGLPARGTLAANPDQSVTYTPAAGYVGPDEFTYTAGDGRGGSAQARVAVEVRRPNAPPVAVPDAATAAAGAPVTVPVLANDNDPDGDRLGLVALGLPRHGALAVNPDQSVTYTPGRRLRRRRRVHLHRRRRLGRDRDARVDVTVEPPPARPTYPNGYLYRRRLAVPAAAVAEGEHQGFPLWVRLRGDWLKPPRRRPAARADGDRGRARPPLRGRGRDPAAARGRRLRPGRRPAPGLGAAAAALGRAPRGWSSTTASPARPRRGRPGPALARLPRRLAPPLGRGRRPGRPGPARAGAVADEPGVAGGSPARCAWPAPARSGATTRRSSTAWARSPSRSGPRRTRSATSAA
jgi:hypothetical protein